MGGQYSKEIELGSLRSIKNIWGEDLLQSEIDKIKEDPSYEFEIIQPINLNSEKKKILMLGLKNQIINLPDQTRVFHMKLLIMSHLGNFNEQLGEPSLIMLLTTLETEEYSKRLKTFWKVSDKEERDKMMVAVKQLETQTFIDLLNKYSDWHTIEK